MATTGSVRRSGHVLSRCSVYLRQTSSYPCCSDAAALPKAYRSVTDLQQKEGPGMARSGSARPVLRSGQNSNLTQPVPEPRSETKLLDSNQEHQSFFPPEIDSRGIRSYWKPLQMWRFSESSDKGWFRSLFVHKVDARKDAHSNLLSKKEISNLYKIQFHNVKPECLDAYNSLQTEVQTRLHRDQDYPCEVVGSWNTWYGEQDQAVHLWRYRGGYPALSDCLQKLRANKEYLDFRKERAKMLISRRNQLLLEFSFWNEPLPREGPNIYELLTYSLKPGTMIEWGNRWARAIKYRQKNNEAVGGFFTQIGDLYVVHHLWAYESLQSREETRNSAWQQEGWDVNVYYTVPLIRSMESRIMIPTKSSPLQ